MGPHVFSILSVLTSIRVKIPLQIAATDDIKKTPFKPHVAVSSHKNVIGNTNVPKKDTISERTGRSRAVKNDEKHISIQPTKYENANILRKKIPLKLFHVFVHPEAWTYLLRHQLQSCWIWLQQS